MFNTINRLETLADEKQCSLAELCRQEDINPSVLRAAKSRGNQLSIDTIEILCYGLGITLSEFFDEGSIKGIDGAKQN